LGFYPVFPSSPLRYIPFSDAKPDSALEFVTSKVAEIEGKRRSLSSSEIELIGRLGGRASDLQTVSVSHTAVILAHI
jgi:hypothetical protein